MFFTRVRNRLYFGARFLAASAVVLAGGFVIRSAVAADPSTRPTTPATRPAATLPTKAPAAARSDVLSPADAKNVYMMGKDAYYAGDYIGARVYLNAARDAGYKPTLFEGEEPAKLLAKMDAKEAADRALMQKAPAPAPTVVAAANTTPPVTPAAPAAGAPKAAATATIGDDMKTTRTVEDIRNQQRIAEAKFLVDQARREREANQYKAALDDYSRAAELDPDNQAAIDGRRDLQAIVVGGSSGSAAGIKAEFDIARGYLRFLLDRDLADARAAIAKRDWAGADAFLTQARVAKDARIAYLSADESKEMDDRIAAVRFEMERAKAGYDVLTPPKTAAEVRAATEAAEAARQAERDATIQALIKNSRELIIEQKYKQALGVIDQIISIDASNEYATGVRQLVEDRANLITEKRWREEKTRNTIKQYVAAEEKLIPYDDILHYPIDWPDISRLRDEEVKTERGQTAEDQRVQAQLDRPLPELKFEAIAFHTVVDFLRDVTGANIWVNWRALEPAGVTKDTPVTARLRDVKFSKALSTILQDVAGGQAKLGYTIDGGVITISTADDLNKNTATKVYDVRDLLIDVPDFQGGDLGGGGGGNNGGNNGIGGNNGGGNVGGGFGGNVGGGGGNVGGGFGGGIGGGGGGGGAGGQQQNQQTRAQLVTNLTKLITDTVARDSWVDNGGQVGSIKELSGQFIITQTPENHRAVMGLLDQLREERAIQVNIEARFLTVSKNFMEDIGLDLDAFLNIRNPNRFSPITITSGTAAFTGTPQTSVPGTIGGASTFSPAMQITGSFLDTFQVNFLLRATQAGINTTFVSAPRLTLFNGQRSFIVVGTTTTYVSSLQATTGTDVATYTPNTSTFTSGVILNVQATVSADRKYVTMTLQPQLQTLLSMQTVVFGGTGATAPTGGTGAGGAGGTTIIGGTETAVGSGLLMLPTYQQTNLATTVTVPDGGTLLLGGQTLAGEIEKESGVPVLDKIPFIKRAFENRSMAKDEQVLLILVKPTILITREQEQKQFPLLSSK